MKEIKADGPTKANMPLENKTVEEINAMLPDIANQIDSMLPGGYGFVLLLAPICNNGIMSYIATINREDAMRLMSEMIRQTEERQKLTGYQRLLLQSFQQRYECNVTKGEEKHIWLLGFDGVKEGIPCEELELISGLHDQTVCDRILSKLIDAFAPPHIKEMAKTTPGYAPTGQKPVFPEGVVKVVNARRVTNLVTISTYHANPPE